MQSLTPKTLAELAQALSAATEKAKIIAGCTDFIIADAASDVGSPQIRAKGTMAGNLCNASPAGDMLPVSWLYDAQLELMNADGTASVTPVNGFITGPQKTILRPDQAVTAILLDFKPLEGFVSASHKIGSRERVSISRE